MVADKSHVMTQARFCNLQCRVSYIACRDERVSTRLKRDLSALTLPHPKSVLSCHLTPQKRFDRVNSRRTFCVERVGH